jgi:hypothetical protein
MDFGRQIKPFRNGRRTRAGNIAKSPPRMAITFGRPDVQTKFNSRSGKRPDNAQNKGFCASRHH